MFKIVKLIKSIIVKYKPHYKAKVKPIARLSVIIKNILHIYKHWCVSYSTKELYVFTWLNTMDTISHGLKLDAATIQGWLLVEGGVYYTEAPSMWLLFNNYNLIELKNK